MRSFGDTQFWLDRMLLLIVSCISVFFLLPRIDFSYFESLRISSPSLYYSFFAVFQVILLSLVVIFGKLVLKKFHSLFYVGVSGGLVLLTGFWYSAFEGWPYHLIVSFYSYSLSFLFIAAIVACVYILLSSKSTDAIDEYGLNESNIRKWLIDGSERPLIITDARKEQVQRLSYFINSGNCHRGIVLKAEYGQGKTTTINMLKPHLNGEWCVVHLSAWNKEQLTKIVLEAIVFELSKHIETHSVRNLPENLVRAIGKEFKLDFFISLLQPSFSDVNLIYQLSKVLQRNGRRCLVVIEDADRGDIADKGKRLNELCSLFDVLTRFDRVKFILTVSEQVDDYAPLSKVLDYQEVLSPISTREILIKFYELCRQDAINREVILVDQSASSETWFLVELENKGIFSQKESCITGLDKVLNNPRILKQCLKKIWHLWQTLSGEVNLTDLIIYTVLSETDNGKKAMEVLTNWDDYNFRLEEDKSTGDLVQELIKKESPYYTLLMYLLDGVRGNGYQAIEVSKSFFHPYLNILQSSLAKNQNAPITQRRLKFIQSLWNVDRNDFAEQELQELLDNIGEYKKSFEAYVYAYRNKDIIDSHGKLLCQMLNYVENKENLFYDVNNETPYGEGYAVRNLLISCLDLGLEAVDFWLEELISEVKERHYTKWILFFNLHSARNYSSHQSRIDKRFYETVDKRIKQLVMNIDVDYLNTVPIYDKWSILDQYTTSWSAKTLIQSMFSKSPIELLASGMKLIGPIVAQTKSDSNDFSGDISRELHVDGNLIDELKGKMNSSFLSFEYSVMERTEMVEAVDFVVSSFSDSNMDNHEDRFQRHKVIRERFKAFIEEDESPNFT